jgi:hypothetical protein
VLINVQGRSSTCFSEGTIIQKIPDLACILQNSQQSGSGETYPLNQNTDKVLPLVLNWRSNLQQLFMMKSIRIKILSLGLVALSLSSFAQKNTYKGFPSLIWPKLYDIEFIKAKDKLGDYDKPVFSVAAKSLQGKKVSLPGYMVPFESGLRGTHFMFSSMPLNACFFCGVGGPETVIEVYVKTPVNYSDKPVEISGVLKLNDKDPDKMIYILENAEVLGEVEL